MKFIGCIIIFSMKDLLFSKLPKTLNYVEIGKIGKKYNTSVREIICSTLTSCFSVFLLFHISSAKALQYWYDTNISLKFSGHYF
jgi:hypothetical protein